MKRNSVMEWETYYKTSFYMQKPKTLKYSETE